MTRRRRLIPRPSWAHARALAVAFLLAPAFAPAADGPATPTAPPSPSPPQAWAPAPPPPRLTVVERVLAQVQGDWQVDYALKYDGPTVLTLAPSEMGAKVEGWLSNSRVPTHANPRRAEAAVVGQSGPTALAEVIPSPDESLRCRERVVFRAWAGRAKSADSRDRGQNANEKANPDHEPAGRSDPEPLSSVTVEPGGLLRVRLRLEHEHSLYGDYDPLLGRREVELRLGTSTIRDALPLDREQYLAQPKDGWAEPPEDRRDTRQFLSAPDSLLLEADVPGNNYYHFERKVRYSSRMRLRFWYRIAPGSEGDFKLRIAQYRSSPSAWKILSDGGSDSVLKGTGRWIKFEKTFRTEAEATTLALDFRIANGDIGEVWIDDVSLEPLDASPDGP